MSSRSSKKVSAEAEEQKVRKVGRSKNTLVNRGATGRLLLEAGLYTVTIGRSSGKASDHDSSGVSSLDKRGKEFLRKLSVAASDIATHLGAKTVSYSHVMSAIKFLDIEPEFNDYPSEESIKSIPILKKDSYNSGNAKTDYYPKRARHMFLAPGKVSRFTREYMCSSLGSKAAALIQFTLERHLMHILTDAMHVSMGTTIKGDVRKNPKNAKIRITASHINSARV